MTSDCPNGPAPSVAWRHHHHHATGRGRPAGGHDNEDAHHDRGLQLAPALGALGGMACTASKIASV